MSKQSRDVKLVLGSIGLVFCCFMILVTLIGIFKLTKLLILSIALLSAFLFYEGLQPMLKSRIRQLVKWRVSCVWRNCEEKLQNRFYAY